MRKGNIRSLLIVIALMIALLFALVLQIIPRMIACSELKAMLYQLEEEIDESPVGAVTDFLATDRNKTLELDMTLSNSSFPEIRCSILTDMQKNRVLAQGSITPGGRETAFSIYLDEQFMAVSSDLLGDGYFGITYDTFAQDLRSIPMLKWIISDNQIEKWDNAAQKIKKQMGNDIQIPSQIQSALPAETLMNWLLVLPVSMNKTTISTDEGPCTAWRLVYQFQSSNLPTYWKSSIPLPLDEDQKVTAAFYLAGETMLMADIRIEEQERLRIIQCERKNGSAQDGIKVLYSESNQDNSHQISALFNYPEDEAESWSIHRNNRVFTLNWDPDKNKMILTNQDDISASVIFRERQDGFSIETTDFYELIRTIGGDDAVESNKKTSCSASVKKGSDFETPGYKNLDQWSFEDFLTLMDGIGSLVGWELGQ